MSSLASLLAMWLDRADRVVGRAVALGQWIALPVCLLLFAQWPLRDLVHGYSIQANDLAQWLFALYVSLAVTYATRERAHLAADAVALRYAAGVRRRIGRVAALACVVPWSLFVLIAGTPMVLAIRCRAGRLSGDRFPRLFRDQDQCLAVGAASAAAGAARRRPASWRALTACKRPGCGCCRP